MTGQELSLATSDCDNGSPPPCVIAHSAGTHNTNSPHHLAARAKSSANNLHLVRRIHAPLPAQLAEQPALSAAQPCLVVLGRQHRARPLCRRPCAAVDAVLHPLDRGVPDPLAVCEGPSAARLA